jgi:polysaccharide export outer membrane protein
VKQYLIFLLIPLLALQNVGLAQNPQNSQNSVTTPNSTPAQPCTGFLCDASARGTTTGSTKEPNYPLNTTGVVPGEIRPNDPAMLNTPATQKNEVIEPPAIPSEFQNFVASSVGRQLPIYGSNLFVNAPSTFAPVDRVPVTADYVIGPGDEILIRAWGTIDVDARVVVDRGGEIYLPRVGNLSVAGLKYQQLQDYCKTAVGRVFRNFDLTVSLGQLRSIQVLVVGQAKHPGTYTVSSLSTLVNTLFASGGPSTSGSMRHIQLNRDNKVLSELDLYSLLLKGDKSGDVRLLPGDVIYIPPVGPTVAVAGSVNVPAIYELRDRATLLEAIALSGGLTNTADGQKALIERIENRRTRKVVELALDEKGYAREVKDGDVVRVYSLSPRFENAVILRGNVARPGRYEWHEGMKIKDLIPSVESLVTRDYWRDVNSISTVGDLRDNQQERSLRESFNDEPPVRTLDATKDVSQKDEVTTNSAGQQPDDNTAELRNDIKRKVPDINWDYAVIQRLNPQDLSTRLIPFNLGKLVLQKEEEVNLGLETGDIVTIFSQADLEVPMASRTKLVRLEGEFRAAGVYKAEPGETLPHLVERIGGMTPKAYLYGAELTRESVRVQQQNGLKQLVDNLEGEIAKNATITPTSQDEVAATRTQLEAQHQLVAKLRQLKATGRVVLELKPDSKDLNSLPDIELEDGDRFVVPSRPSTVDVLGSVYNKSSFLHRTDRSLGDYLKAAGGATREADKGRMFVVRADGSVLNKQTTHGFWNGGFESLRLMPGDAVVVPERLSRGSLLKNLKDWTQILSQFALGVAAVKVIQD